MVSANNSCQRRSLAFQRLAACLVKVGCDAPARGSGRSGRVVAPEVRKEVCVFVESQELTEDLDGVSTSESQSAWEFWSACSSEAPEILEAVVDEAEDGHDEGAKRSKGRPPLRLVLLAQHRA